MGSSANSADEGGGSAGEPKPWTPSPEEVAECDPCAKNLDGRCEGCGASVSVWCAGDGCAQCDRGICHHCDYDDIYCSDECANAGSVREGLAW